jgi:hypothetical protein
MAGRTEPFLLSKAAARSAVDQSMALRLSFSFNMQHSLVSRRAIDRLAVRGPFYQSPYPDYYASNVMLLTADAMLVVPEPLVAIGISPKSFGYFYFNGREDEGTAFLNNLGASSIPESARKWIVPGSVLLTCWFLAMAAIEQNFGREFGVRADHDRYRYLQVLHLDRRAGWNVLRELYSALSAGEILRYGSRRALLLIAARLLPARAAARYVEETTIREGPFPRFDPKKRPVDYRDILELFEDWPRFRRDLSATAN